MKKHFIEVENGEEVAAVHHEASSDKWMFLCHGFGGNKDRGNKGRADAFNEVGWNTVRLDFRGNGESDGKFIDQDLSSRIEDLEAVIDYFRPDRCVLFGTSFGAKVVFHAALENDIEGIVAKMPVTYNKTMSKFEAVIEEKGRFEYIDGKPINGRFMEDLKTYSFSDVEDRLDVPVFISHGAGDQTVHIEHSINAVKNLDVDVEFQKLKGVKHSYTDEGKRKMNSAVKAWLSNLPE
jgi:pimeloyl-ACP methyl ester carboxylesterase